MGKALIIAEKPSVATDISRALGGFKKTGPKGNEYYENDDYVISSAVGHLLELVSPSEVERKKGKWSFENLPDIPDRFHLRAIPRTESRLKLLKKLMKRKDVDRLINACDAGREGELIFRYIVQDAKEGKPIDRLWLQSMTLDAIRDGFKNLKPGHDLEPLADAAYCRSESDWLVGINGTRALTAFNSRNGGFQKTTVGRVQTPTLTLVVERDEKIKNFQAKSYWEVHAEFGAKAGTYFGRWFDESFKKPKKDQASEEDAAAKRAERIWSEKLAHEVLDRCEGKAGIATEEKKPTTQIAPMLYDLTSLQREANSRLSLPARRTLQIAQALYERYKVCTYPRTDARCLPEDYKLTVLGVLKTLQGTSFSSFATEVLNKNWVNPNNKRVFNNAKISDHFAIIPTSTKPDKLPDIESKVYDMIARRFLAVFFPVAKFEVTTRVTRIESDAFKTEGKILVDPGWLAVYGKKAGTTSSGANRKTDEDGRVMGVAERAKEQEELCAIEDNEQVKTLDIEMLSLQTRPPARYTEATLLSAMESAGKLVDDEDLREAMSERGLGTPATRASVIENLLSEEYLRREGREISAAPKAFALLELLKALDVPSLSSPEMTGEWEYKLREMEHGQISRHEFMREITDLTAQIVDKAKTFDESEIKAKAKPLSFKSPHGKSMVETLRNYEAEDGSFSMRKVMGGRLIEPEEVAALFEKGLIGPLEGFRSRAGWPFSAPLKYNPEENKVEFIFDNSPVNANGDKMDLDKEESVATCPVCGGRVVATLLSYACENSFGEEPSCKLKVGRNILKQEITVEQLQKLFDKGETDFHKGFISNRTRKPFTAKLVWKDKAEGITGFEFQDNGKGKGKAPIRKGAAKKSTKKTVRKRAG